MEIDRGNHTLNIKEFFDMVESRQRTLNETADEDMELKLCRNVVDKISPNDSSSKSSISSKDIHQLLQLPKPLWTSLSSTQQKAYLQWKNATAKGTKVQDSVIKGVLAGTTPSTKETCRRKKKKCGAL